MIGGCFVAARHTGASPFRDVRSGGARTPRDANRVARRRTAVPSAPRPCKVLTNARAVIVDRAVPQPGHPGSGYQIPAQATVEQSELATIRVHRRKILHGMISDYSQAA
jgi:hypothetical protein